MRFTGENKAEKSGEDKARSEIKVIPHGKSEIQVLKEVGIAACVP